MATLEGGTDAAVERLNTVRAAIERAAQGRAEPAELVAVSKTFEADAIRPVLDAGQRVFGENRVQEAKAKWPELREAYGDVELHLIGPLQSNKAKDAVALFDVIQSVDREKIATALAKAADGVSEAPRVMVQVNVGREPQKAGVDPDEAVAFADRCRALGLTVIGLMAIPPIDEPPGPHFAKLSELAREVGVPTSMGMSADYEEAIGHGARWVRVGSAIFGTRPSPAQ